MSVWCGAGVFGSNRRRQEGDAAESAYGAAMGSAGGGIGGYFGCFGLHESFGIYLRGIWRVFPFNRFDVSFWVVGGGVDYVVVYEAPLV